MLLSREAGNNHILIYVFVYAASCKQNRMIADFHMIADCRLSINIHIVSNFCPSCNGDQGYNMALYSDFRLVSNLYKIIDLRKIANGRCPDCTFFYNDVSANSYMISNRNSPDSRNFSPFVLKFMVLKIFSSNATAFLSEHHHRSYNDLR